MTLGRFTVGALVFAFLLLGGGTVERADAAGQPFQELWGDLNCNGEAQSGDALHVLRHVAGLTVFIPEGTCDTQMGMFPDTLLQIEGGRQVQWADVDCSGKVTAVDTLRILRFVAGLPNTVAAGCPEIGAMTTLSIAQ